MHFNFKYRLKCFGYLLFRPLYLKRNQRKINKHQLTNILIDNMIYSVDNKTLRDYKNYIRKTNSSFHGFSFLDNNSLFLYKTNCTYRFIKQQHEDNNPAF